MSSKIKFKHTSKLISAIVLVALMICMMVTSVVPAFAATNQAVNDVANGLLNIRMGYKHDNVEHWYYSGTCFLINSNTILTCEHVIGVDADAENYFNTLEGGKFKPSNVIYEVVVHKDVTVKATLKKSSIEDDYAILTLNESINRPYITLGDSSSIVATDQVFALGFPGEVAEIQNVNTYTSDDVTVTEGLVQKRTEYLGTAVIQHGATLTPGNSGGPLVDVNGYVVGINKMARVDETGDKDYFYAVEIDQIKNVLDALFIEYTEAGAVPAPTDAPVVTDASVVTDAPAPTLAPTNPVAPAPKTDTTKIIIIAAIVVLVLALAAVVVIILVNTSKKKPAPAPVGPNGGMVPPSAPVQRQAPPTPPYAQPYSRPSMPPQNAAPVMNNDGAGETSVLNEGAGETTVLGGGGQATGFTLIRAKGGERININKPEFTIGKEKRRVDYCISDNNSVSRAHAKFRVRGGRCYITDLGSTNCTFVNGNKLSPNQEVILSGGDKIKISDEEFEFVG